VSADKCGFALYEYLRQNRFVRGQLGNWLSYLDAIQNEDNPGIVNIIIYI
jgi:hypothetical protein